MHHVYYREDTKQVTGWHPLDGSVKRTLRPCRPGEASTTIPKHPGMDLTGNEYLEDGKVVRRETDGT